MARNNKKLKQEAAPTSAAHEEFSAPGNAPAEVKAKATGAANAVPVQEWEYMYPVALLSLAAAASPISQLTMAPVYGSIPSAVNHATMCSVSLLFGFELRTLAGELKRLRILEALTVWAFSIPVLQVLLLPFSGSLGPVVGPILNGFLSCHTILLLTGFVLADFASRYRQTAMLASRVGIVGAHIIIGVVIAFAMYPILEEKYASIVQWLPELFEDKFEVNPIHLQLALGASYALLAPTWYVALALPAIGHTLLFNRHMSIEKVDISLRSHNWTILDRQWSNTGYISVLESTTNQYRVLRADHSLLGGEWLLTPSRTSKEGWKVNEPIYSVFSMLESVRLLHLETPVPDTSVQALVIGLGIGTAPKAMLAHGIATTIVELDPVVHRFAMEYFGLPGNHTAVLRDAVIWVKQQAQAATLSALPATEGETSITDTGSSNLESEAQTNVKTKKLYDYIIHDVFTGGAEPLELFNTAFLRNLRSLLTPDGAIALNYAGDLSLPLTRLVLRTIDNTFDGQCKIFRDGPPEKHNSNANAKSNAKVGKGAGRDDSGGGVANGSNKQKQEEEEPSDFLNMVVFCRNSRRPISFRQPTPADYLGSLSRKHYMLPKPEWEIPFPEQISSAGGGSDKEKANLDPGDESSWAGQQVESAKRHWRIMREVMPDAVWELW
ncbi:putative S-adenosyl-L-methionine-dependent methyltransferase [Septoria linicola]|nr:putative S-adenosyl-L-methionine-dependent methyltransferase [Septoria linicola]